MPDAIHMRDDLVAVFISVNNLPMTLRAVTAKVGNYRHEHGRSRPPQPSVRCQLQRFCSQCKQFQGNDDLFYNPTPGVWQMRPTAYQRLI